MALTDEDKAWIAGRFDTIDNRLDGIDNRLDGIDNRLNSIDNRLDGTNDHLNATEERLSRYILEMRSEVIRRLDTVDQRLDFMGNALSQINVQPLTKGMVDLGAMVGSVTRSQAQSTDRHFDLETRVARLEQQIANLKPAA